MVSYNLSHLTQNENQAVIGPIQDDEALFLYALIRVMKIKTVVEIGGMSGYSALNFCKAVGDNGVVISIDVHKTPKVANNHVSIQQDAKLVEGISLGIKKIDLLFFDCHNYEAQMSFYHNMENNDFLNDETIIALHDTVTHGSQIVNWSYHTDQGYVHQKAERKMVNKFVEMGYSAFCGHASVERQKQANFFRHGITILSKFKKLSL